MRDALNVVLSGHEPYPAVAVDRAWNMVAANSAMVALTAGLEIAPELRIGDVFLLIAGLVAVAAALTWKRYGLFRPDLSLTGAADLLGLVATILLAWLIIFDFPSGASREVGVFLALAGAIAIAAGVADYSTLRGAPLFPRIDALSGEARPEPPTDR